MNSDDSLATPPIALVEVQGYVYRAKMLIADLYERDGDKHVALKLRGEAAELKKNFNRDFWANAASACAASRWDAPLEVESVSRITLS